MVAQEVTSTGPAISLPGVAPNRNKTTSSEPDARPSMMPWKTFALRDLETEEPALTAWVRELNDRGAVLVSTEGYPQNDEDFVGEQGDPMAKCPLLTLTNLFGFRTACGYGEFFRVHKRVGDEVINASYTCEALALHTDLPDSRTPPEVQFLYFQRATLPEDGGFSLLCDGNAVAEQIRKQEPEAYRLLCETPVPYLDLYAEKWGQQKVEFYYKCSHPVINEPTIKGRRTIITHSDHHRSPKWGGVAEAPVPEDEQPLSPAFHRALELWRRTCVELQGAFLVPQGHILVFDNLRMLHGRTAFSPTRERKLIGTYVRWDEIEAVAAAREYRARVEKKRLQQEDPGEEGSPCSKKMRSTSDLEDAMTATPASVDDVASSSPTSV